MMVQMIGIGEQTGSLDTLMTKLANFYEEEVEQLTSGLLSVIEPFNDCIFRFNNRIYSCCSLPTYIFRLQKDFN